MNLWMQFNAVASLVLLLLLIAGFLMDIWYRMQRKNGGVW